MVNHAKFPWVLLRDDTQGRDPVINASGRDIIRAKNPPQQKLVSHLLINDISIFICRFQITHVYVKVNR